MNLPFLTKKIPVKVKVKDEKEAASQKVQKVARPEKEKSSSPKLPLVLFFIFIVIVLLGIAGGIYLGFGGKDDQSNPFDITPTPAPKNISTPLPETPMPTISSDIEEQNDMSLRLTTREELEVFIEDVFNRQSYSEITPYINESAGWFLFETECCGIFSRDEVGTRLSTLAGGAAQPWNFDQKSEDAIFVQFNYVPDTDVFVGVSQDDQFLAFIIDPQDARIDSILYGKVRRIGD